MLAGSLALFVLATATASPSLADNTCPPDPQPGMTGSIGMKPAPRGVNHELTLTAIWDDTRSPVAGSQTLTVDGPGGPYTVTPASDNDPTSSLYSATFTPRVAGTYSASASQQVYACEDTQWHYATDGAQQQFDIVPEQDAREIFSALVARPYNTKHPGKTTLATFWDCPPATVASKARVVTGLYWEMGNRLPTHASPHMTTTAAGCYGGGDRKRDRLGPSFFATAGGGLASVTIEGPARARVLIEVSVGGKLVNATRAVFSPARDNREGIRADSAPCTGLSGGCDRFQVHRR